MTELTSWKQDAIRLLGEKVKAENERDDLIHKAKNVLNTNLPSGEIGANARIELINFIAEIEGK